MHLRRCARLARLLAALVVSASALVSAAPVRADTVPTTELKPGFAQVTVGQTLKWSVTIRNDSTGAETGPVTLGAIGLLPACVFDLRLPPAYCNPFFPDVVTISAATGESGTACARDVFTISLLDAASGEVAFVPSDAIVLPENTKRELLSSACQINFKATYLQVPHNAPDDPNNSTFAQLAVHGSAHDGVDGGYSVESAVDIYPGRSQLAAATTTPTAGFGSTLTDKATLTVPSPPGVTPTGSITFAAYGPRDPRCARTPAFTSVIDVSAAGSFLSAPFTPSALGAYSWSASYSGDTNYTAVTGTCAAAGQRSTVSQASPTLTTTASAATTLGSDVSDTASLSGGYRPGGTITFKLYGPQHPACTGTPAATTTANVNGNGSYSSGPLVPNIAGTYRFRASYSGDDDNNLVPAGACGLAGETVTVAAPPRTTTSTTTSTAPTPANSTTRTSTTSVTTTSATATTAP